MYLFNIQLGDTNFATELKDEHVSLLAEALQHCYTEDQFKSKVIKYQSESIEFLFRNVDDRNFVRSALNDYLYSLGIPPLPLEQSMNVLFGRVPHTTMWTAKVSWIKVA